MGIFKTIGRVAGAAVGFAVGGPGGAAAGYKVGGKVGKVADKVKGNSTEAAPAAASERSDITGLFDNEKDIDSILGADTQAAEVYDVVRNHPDPKVRAWSETLEWNRDLGGDAKRIRPEVLGI